jgi:anti-anti-sigma factor
MLQCARDGTLTLASELELIAVHEAELGTDIAEAMAVHAGQFSEVVCDLSRVREIDSRGIGLVVDLHRRCRQQGAHLRVTGVSPHIRRVFDLFQLGALFPVEEAAEPVGFEPA